jgi:hypothetical protein
VCVLILVQMVLPRAGFRLGDANGNAVVTVAYAD